MSADQIAAHFSQLCCGVGEKLEGDAFVFLAKLHVGDDEGEELEAGDELVVPPERRVVAALVVNHTGVEESGSFRRVENALRSMSGIPCLL